MKTREQAEERALELYPEIKIKGEKVLDELWNEVLDNENKGKREAFLQCYDELSQHKDISKTCGFCVEPSEKAKQKEALIELTQMGECGNDKQKELKCDACGLPANQSGYCDVCEAREWSKSVTNCPNCGTKRIEYADAKECPNCETFEPTITSVTNCPTCGAECNVKGEGETHYYLPKANDKLTIKQAESICIGFYNDLVSHLESGLSTDLFHGEIVFKKHLKKALK